jgi:hypothetical protein
VLDPLHVEEAVAVIERVPNLEPVRVLELQRFELFAEDDRAYIAVRIDQPEPSRRGDERGLDERDARRDAAAAGEEADGTRLVVEDEEARGRDDHQGVTLLDVIVDPVGDAAFVDALDGHLEFALDLR